MSCKLNLHPGGDCAGCDFVMHDCVALSMFLVDLDRGSSELSPISIANTEPVWDA